MEPKKPFSETVAEKLIEQLKEGTAPWQKPWEPGQPGAFLPTNPTTGKRYRGINAIQLMSQGRSDQRWMTYKQATAMGAQVRKGEKGTPIQYWKFSDEQIKTDDDGKPVLNAQGELVKQSVKLERPRVFMATVFNAEQIDGLAPLLARQQRDWTAVERAEHILQASGADIRHGEQNRAFYKLATDSIHMPGKDQFPTADNYYATALHELGHWSGHALRLDRDLSHPFGSQGYAKEELRAEIASMILGDELGIGHDPGQHAAYVGSWIKALQDDPLEIFRAAADAEKIQDYVLGLAQQLKQQQDQQPDQPLAKAQALPHHPQAFFDANGMLRDWNTADVMPPDWQGIAKRNDTLRLDGREGSERSFTALQSKTMLQARQEVVAMPSRPPEANDAAPEQNPHEQAANLARAIENAVRRDPNSTHEQMSAAQKARKDAHTLAVLGEADMQRRIAEFERERGQQQAEAQIPSQLKAEAPAQKIFLQVPFREKDEARALGAKWDRQAQSWYALAGSDAGRFAKWAQDSASPAVNTLKAEPTTEGARQDPQASEERQYLAVPYGERIAARAAGAQWDKAAKSWYAGPKADMQKLARWKLENMPHQQGPSMSPHEEFADALRSVGCVVSGEHPLMDGQKHRISVEGEKHSDKAGSGFYVGFLDGHPAGYIKNNKTGIDMKWKSKGYTFDPGEKARMAAEAASKLQARQSEQAQAHEVTAQRVARQMADLVPVEQPTSYMLAKGIEPQAGVFTDREGRTTYIPATDVNGKQWTMQYIQEGGTKRFAKDSRKEGCFHVVGTLAALAQAPALVISEGYATASSLSQSLGFATVCAFDSGNLPVVAKALHEKFPDKPVIIAGDDDRHLELTQGVNPGRAKAQEAAKITGGKAMLPIFAPGENSYPVSLAPVTPEKFREHQRTGSALSEQQLAALDRMKGRTDFNDLANKSVLGKDGIDRQVRCAVQDVIAKHTVQIEQQQTHQQQKAVQRIDQHRRRSARMS
jgi:putative DNA primase/helicase